jgi:hypothetical protein
LSTDGRRPSGAQLVDDRVLDLQRAEVGVVDARAMAAELHRQGAVGRQVVGPVDRVHAVVEVFGVLHREALEHQQHAVGQARPEAQAVSGFHVGHAAHGRGVLAHLLKAKPDGFFDEQAFKAFGAGEEEFETVRHGIPEPLASDGGRRIAGRFPIRPFSRRGPRTNVLQAWPPHPARRVAKTA